MRRAIRRNLGLAILRSLAVLIVSIGLWSGTVFALTFPMPAPGDDIVGEIQTVVSQPGDTLALIGMRYDIGGYEMVQSNPNLPRTTLKPGTQVIVPTQFILPANRKGLVINLAELRGYYFPENENIVFTFPVGVGHQGWNTPRRTGTIVSKEADPTWFVPKSIQAEAAQHGINLPHAVPPGPKNPLGKFALHLSIPSVLLHGTNAPLSVGLRSSHGCIRLFAQDIEYLFNHVPVGTPIQILYEQDKVGWYQGHLYLESEVPFPEFDDSSTLQARITEAAQTRSANVDWNRVANVSDEQLGIPTPIN